VVLDGTSGLRPRMSGGITKWESTNLAAGKYCYLVWRYLTRPSVCFGMPRQESQLPVLRLPGVSLISKTNTLCRNPCIHPGTSSIAANLRVVGGPGERRRNRLFNFRSRIVLFLSFLISSRFFPVGEVLASSVTTLLKEGGILTR